MAAVAWVNGRIVDADEPAVAVTDRGFLYGEGLFETMRAYGGRVFRLTQHLARLTQGARAIDLPLPPAEQVMAAVQQALAASELSEASVRLSLTPGPAGAAQPTLVVLVRELVLPPAERYATGCDAITIPAAVVHCSPLRRIKSLSYLDKLLAQRQAQAAGAHEALLVDPGGYVVEGAMRNVFAVIRGTLVTPPLSRGLLPGVTRAAVLECARRQRRLLCEERDLPLEELLTAQECFLTSSLAEILPVASVGGTLLAAPGPVTRALTDAYRALVASELAS